MHPLACLPAQLPRRYWLADAHVPARLLDAAAPTARMAVLVEDGTVAAIAPHPLGDAERFAVDGATLVSAFVDPHVHLDKGDLLASGLAPADTLLQAVDAARADYARWTADELRRRIDFGMRTAFAHGTRALNTYCDWPAPEGGLAWRVLQDVRSAWAGRIELQLTALVDTSDFADAARGQAIARTVAAGGGRLGLFVYPGVRPDDLRSAFAFAQRYGLAPDLHVDEHLDPPVTHLELVAALAREFGLGARTLCSHACVLGVLDDAQRDRALDAIAAAGMGLVALPYTNLYLQDSRREDGLRRSPRRRGLLPVHEARQRGIPLAFGSDNHRDPFFPGGDLDPLQLLALAALASQLDDPLDGWIDTVTRTPATLLGLSWDGVLRPGAPADLVLHPGRSSAEVLPRAGTGRLVLRRGQRLAPEEASLPDFRVLANLRGPSARSPD